MTEQFLAFEEFKKILDLRVGLSRSECSHLSEVETVLTDYWNLIGMYEQVEQSARVAGELVKLYRTVMTPEELIRRINGYVSTRDRTKVGWLASGNGKGPYRITSITDTQVEVGPGIFVETEEFRREWTVTE